jgi:hypothetical protein
MKANNFPSSAITHLIQFERDEMKSDDLPVEN